MQVIRRIVLWMFTLLLCPLWANAQYSTTYHYGDIDIGSYATSGTNAWKLLGGSGTCTQVVPAYDANDWCLGGTNGQVFLYAGGASQTWNFQSAMGSGIMGLAVQDSNNIWALKATTACTAFNAGVYGVFKWSGSAWTQTANGCMSQVRTGRDGTLVGVNGSFNQLFSSADGGNTWTQIGTNLWNDASVADALTMCGVRGGQLYTMVSGAMTLYSPQPAGTTAKCALSNDYLKTKLLATLDTSGVVHLLNYAGTAWGNVTGTVSSLAGIDRGSILVLDSSGHPKHLNLTPLWVQGVIGGSWTGCPAQGDPCGQGVTHSAKIQVKYPHSLNGLAASQVASSTPWAITVSTWDANPFCDPLLGDPTTDPECFIGAPQPQSDQVICSASGENLTSGTLSFSCLRNIVPRRGVGWSKLSAIDVFISDHWNTTQAGSICSGISSWMVVNASDYTCQSASAPPLHSDTGSYIWVSYNPTYVDLFGHPMGSNSPCGYYFDNGYHNKSECPVNGVLKHPWIVLGPYSDTQLQGAAAHEEGHSNWLENCKWTCQVGGSAMGSQGTWESTQPIAPTNCDILWAGIWGAI